MSTSRLAIFTLLQTLGATAPLLAAEQTLLLQEPTLSAEHVVFRYAEDLWTVRRGETEARRLTSSPGTESTPLLSPDGSLVAFTGQYEGNTDVYVIPVGGGVPRRLTWHPGGDTVLAWHPDGDSVIFRSQRSSPSRFSEAFQVTLRGGTPTKLEIPKVHHLSLNEGATHVAYTPVRDAFSTWKRYRGGRTTPIWIFNRQTHDVEEVPHVNASDTFPCWVDGVVYFASDRDGVMNLHRFRPGSSEVEQLTHYRDFHIRSLRSDGRAVIFEQAGSLHVFDPATDDVQDLSILVRSDGLESLPRWQNVSGHVRSFALSPNGKRAAFEARGEIMTVPKEHGDARNLSSSPGAHDRSPAWSPDGKHVAWFSDASGEYRLVVSDRRGREERRTFRVGKGGFYHAPVFSPDGKHVLYYGKANRIAYVTLSSGKVTQVAHIQGSLGVVHPDAVWSADSKWIAFTDRNERTLYDHIALHEVGRGRNTRLTDDFATSGSPAFSPDGKYLYFSASVDRGPRLMGLNMGTSASRPSNENLYVAVLQADAENPLAPRSDDAEDEEDEDGDDDKEKDEGDQDDEGSDDKSKKVKKGKPKNTEDIPALDLTGLDQRILSLPIGRGSFAGLRCAKEKLLYLEQRPGQARRLMSFDYDEREAKELIDEVDSFDVSADGKSLLTRKGGSYKITKANGKDAKTLDIANVKVRVEPEVEWPQILREVWRIERDYFYDANMHGVNWEAMWKRWEAFLPHVRHRADLNLLIRELIGELSCGHEYVWGGETPKAPSGVAVGLLGADFKVERGRHRITRILSGQNWRPGSRAPLTEPGVDARVGDYLIAVNGRPVDGDDNLFEAFENTADKQVDITLSAHANGRDPRTSSVVPVGSEWRLRHQTWVEDNRRRVDELSGGRLAYIYMPNTGGSGRAEFDRDFYSQLGKDGLILDERYNGGGQVADYVIDVLSREVMSYWMNREEWLARSPSGVMDGPKVMIINQSAGSGGDWMPWAFKQRGIGPLVGTRTWGGLVGISGYPPLMDGGQVTAASFGVMDTEGNWVVENVGVAPDYEVIEYPKELIAGRDPQLERAVALAMDELAKTTPKPLPKYHAPAER